MNEPATIEIQSSAIAAACLAVGHRMRTVQPCVWFRETIAGEAKDVGIYFFPEGQPADLDLSAVISTWRDVKSSDKAKEEILELIPENLRATAIPALDRMCIGAMRHFHEHYRMGVMPELRRSKRATGFHVERRGNKVAIIGANMKDADVAELKREGKFS